MQPTIDTLEMNRPMANGKLEHRATVGAASMLFAVVVSGCTELQPQAGPQPCSEGTETRRSVVNMKDLAEQEARTPPAAKPPKVVHEPLPGPKEHGDTGSRQSINCLP